MPSSLKALRGFLGLTEYYQRFIKCYDGLARPLTRLLKKGGFINSSKVEEAFIRLKRAMVNPSVIGLLNFCQPFQIKCDAFEKAIRAVLIQKRHPIALFT